MNNPAGQPSKTSELNIAPGSIVEVRDEEWLVTATETTEAQKLLIHVQGLSELVRDTTAMFYETLDAIKSVDPATPKGKCGHQQRNRRQIRTRRERHYCCARQNS